MAEDWTLSHEKFIEVVAKNKIRKARQMISKEGAVLLELAHPMTGETPLYLCREARLRRWSPIRAP